VRENLEVYCLQNHSTFSILGKRESKDEQEDVARNTGKPITHLSALLQLVLPSSIQEYQDLKLNHFVLNPEHAVA
jgi:hypothetical protein